VKISLVLASTLPHPVETGSQRQARHHRGPAVVVAAPPAGAAAWDYGGGFGLIPIIPPTTMAWTTPTLVEICIGLEINGYLPAEF
jgi:coenzyme PQQ precursor peptide PqqA